MNRTNKINSLIDGTWLNPDVSGASKVELQYPLFVREFNPDVSGASKVAHRRKVLDKLLHIWAEAGSRDEAVAGIRDAFHFDADTLKSVVDWLDLKQATFDALKRGGAGSDLVAEAFALLHGVSHRFRIGNDTVYDVVDLFELINPNIKVEDLYEAEASAASAHDAMAQTGQLTRLLLAFHPGAAHLMRRRMPRSPICR